ncbi:MAG: hypothetical protein HQL46_00980 [Gammaproteobacteria bacterium]|nr:hypothetical protein [Gammaproteobacteria bacterium]
MLLFLAASAQNINAQPTTSSEVISSPNEGDTNHTNYFLLQLSRPLTTEVSVDFETKDGTATIADNDYTETRGTAIIEPNSISTTIAVEIIGDTKSEPDETFSLILSNPQGISFPAGVTSITKTRTIVNDDSTSTGGGNGSTDSTSNAISKPQVVDCSTLSSDIGTNAVSILNKYNYKKCSMVAGILIANSNETLVRGQDITAMTQSLADILAELLDNNQDGVVDDPAVVQNLKSGANGAWLNMQSAANETNEGPIVEELLPYVGKDMGVKNSWLVDDYGSSTGYSENLYEKHMLVEEAMHMIHSYGYAKAYPTVWGDSLDGCKENSSEGCNWEQSTLTKLAFEAMTSSNNWYYHGENTTNNTGQHITGTCATPYCAAIEFIMNVVSIYREMRGHDSDVASSGTEFPSTSEAMTTMLNSSVNGQAMKAVLDELWVNGMTWTYNPGS